MSYRLSALCAILALVGSALSSGCARESHDPHDAGSVASHLFTLAKADPQPEELRAFFDPELLSTRAVSLLDALNRIEGVVRPERIRVEQAPDAAEAFVDLEVELPGAGLAGYSVQLRAMGEEGWRIAWFQGPGVEWPPRDRKGASLTTSAPPQSPAEP